MGRRRREEGLSVYIYHPRASHNPLECDMNDGGGGKVPWQRSLTCEFMQIHMKPEPKMFPVSARREKNQRTQPLNTRSVHPNFILTGRRGTSCSSHILHTIKISLKIQHCDVNNKQVQNSKLLSNKH